MVWNSVVVVVQEVFFDCDWSCICGSVFCVCVKQMVCVVMGYFFVIFKVICDGGMYNKVQLCNQLEYLIIKLSFIIDSCGIYDG